MPVELDKITFSDKVLVGKDGIERKQLSLIYVPEVPTSRQQTGSKVVLKSYLKTVPVSFAEMSQPREREE